MIRLKTKLIVVVTTMIILLVFVFHLLAYGAEPEEVMAVNASWIDYELLRIDIVDTQRGSTSSLAVPLNDFVTDTESSPYILIQAVYLDGSLSGVIQISNPFYTAEADVKGNYAEPPYQPASDSYPEELYSNEYDTAPPRLGFTPDGTGTVIDNVVNQQGVEFFTVFTEEGNEFFLIVDRQRNTDNVYLLNTVTESDLMALAEKSGNIIKNPAVSVIPPVEELHNEVGSMVSQTIAPEPESSTAGNNRSNQILILIIILAAGGIAYYLKVIKPKRDAAGFDDTDDEYGYDDTEEHYGDSFEDDDNDSHSESDGETR